MEKMIEQLKEVMVVLPDMYTGEQKLGTRLIKLAEELKLQELIWVEESNKVNVETGKPFYKNQALRDNYVISKKYACKTYETISVVRENLEKTRAHIRGQESNSKIIRSILNFRASVKNE